MATLGLLRHPQISYESQRDLTPAAMFFAACLFLFALVRTLERPSVVNYGLAGLAVSASACCSKYNFCFAGSSAFIVLAIDRQFRARLLDPRVLATFLVAAIVGRCRMSLVPDHMGERHRAPP